MKLIDGKTLKSIFISGSNNLYNHYPEVDALNVFPVPDGDTGMNMNLTLTSGVMEIQNSIDNSAYNVAKTFSKGLLMGARGNSGVITSQIFRGFAESLKDKDEISPLDFANALSNGADVAYKAVIRPVEGTILTVIRESSRMVLEKIDSDSSFDKLFEELIYEARESLKRTPDLLPVLKDVGVVDSGGSGLLYIFEGFKLAYSGLVVERREISRGKTLSPAGAKIADEEFGYCTEFIMSLGPDSAKKPFNEKRFTMILSSHGNSLAVVRDEEIVKVHIHTLNPGGILNYAQQFGEFIKVKIENMTEQHHALESGSLEDELIENHGEEISNIDQDSPYAEYAVIAVASGKGIEDLFKNFGASKIVSGGQTMNPSSEDFVKAIKEVHAKNVYILPNNSNILMSASQACELVDDCNAFVIPSKSIIQGLSAVSTFSENEDTETNFRNMKAALKNTKPGEVTFSIRDTEMDGLTIKKDNFIGMFDKHIVSTHKDKVDCLKELINKMVDDESSLITVICGHDISMEDMKLIKKEISNEFEDYSVDFKYGDQPVYSFYVGVE